MSERQPLVVVELAQDLVVAQVIPIAHAKPVSTEKNKKKKKRAVLHPLNKKVDSLFTGEGGGRRLEERARLVEKPERARSTVAGSRLRNSIDRIRVRGEGRRKAVDEKGASAG